MATNLPVSIDADYADDGSPSRKAHQQHHDAIHGYTNSHDGATDPHTVYVKKAGGDTITASAASVIPLVVKGAASQTANLLEARNDAGSVRAKVSSNGGIFSESALIAGDAAAADLGAYMQVRGALAGAKGLVVRGAASQTANLIEAQLSDGTLRTFIDAGGGVRVANGAQGFDGNAWLQIAPVSAANKGLVVRGAASQSANLVEVQNSAGTVLASVGPTGHFTCHDAVSSGVTRGIQFGAVDSAGAGFRTVRVPN